MQPPSSLVKEGQQPQYRCSTSEHNVGAAARRKEGFAQFSSGFGIETCITLAGPALLVTATHPGLSCSQGPPSWLQLQLQGPEHSQGLRSLLMATLTSGAFTPIPSCCSPASPDPAPFSGSVGGENVLREHPSLHPLLLTITLPTGPPQIPLLPPTLTHTFSPSHPHLPSLPQPFPSICFNEQPLLSIL